MSDVVLQDRNGTRWLHFGAPVAVIATHNPGEVPAKLAQVEAAVNGDGLWAAGFVSYEAAAGFGLDCHPAGEKAPPLLWFGLYPPANVQERPLTRPGSAYTLGSWTPSISQHQYDDVFARIKAYIARGHTYQVNYSLRLRASFRGNPCALFYDLAQAQRGHYAAYVDTGRHALCSASPELFFTLRGDRICTRPMKGTAARGLTLAGDEAQREWLHHSEKNRAENVMIVDMIRNDVGRVARVASVRVPRLFAVERYPTLWQMTSTVEARTGASFADVMAALFPCASITGAPKVRTMEIIREVEASPRGVYTGCIGYLAPGREAQFNVAIRTVVVDKASGQAEYGVGGGIVWDSEAGDEYRECQLKARVLTQPRPEFDLLETLLWTPDAGFFLLDEHVQRLLDSATYFGIPADGAAVRAALETGFFRKDPVSQSPVSHKVRLLVAQDGRVSVKASPLAETAVREPVRLALAPRPVDVDNPFLYHKTTRREVYEEARASRPGADDVLLWNEQGHLTEATIANVVLRLDGELVTPPVTAGLLPGTFRAHLLAQGTIRERPLPVKALSRCEAIYLVNSVRKWRKAALVDPSPC